MDKYDIAYNPPAPIVDVKISKFFREERNAYW
jgi:hypothetical protein